MSKFNIVQPSATIETEIYEPELLENIESFGRTAYKSEAHITNDSAVKFVKMLIKSGHESVLEHQSITVRFICDRGVSHELVRHRIASFTQESTRYCNYQKKGLNFIKPLNFRDDKRILEAKVWSDVMQFCTDAYNQLLGLGVIPENARSVLPFSLKTELVMTANIREWRSVLKTRLDPKAHPDMVDLMRLLLGEFKDRMPVLFEDIP